VIAPADKASGVPIIPATPATTVTVYQKKVMIVLPWNKQVHPVTSYCVGQLIDRRRTSSVLNFGDAFVAHSRNSCADVFLGTDCEWMMTIDDDMVIPFGHANWFRGYTGFKFPDQFMGLNALDRLMSHKKSLVGALYFGRHPGGPPVYNEGASNAAEAAFARNGPHDFVKPTKWVGTGCMLIHRSVFEAIEKKFPRLMRGGDGKGGQWFTSTEASLLDEVTRVRDMLSKGPLDGKKAYDALAMLEDALTRARAENVLGYGEDVSFCLRAAAAGHPAHIDMGLICGHIGSWVYGPSK
jgi:hypothetical protein